MKILEKLVDLFERVTGIEPGTDPKNEVLYGGIAGILGGLIGYQLAGGAGLMIGGAALTYLGGKMADGIARNTGIDLEAPAQTLG